MKITNRLAKYLVYQMAFTLLEEIDVLEDFTEDEEIDFKGQSLEEFYSIIENMFKNLSEEERKFIHHQEELASPVGYALNDLELIKKYLEE